MGFNSFSFFFLSSLCYSVILSSLPSLVFICILSFEFWYILWLAYGYLCSQPKQWTKKENERRATNKETDRNFASKHSQQVTLCLFFFGGSSGGCVSQIPLHLYPCIATNMDNLLILSHSIPLPWAILFMYISGKSPVFYRFLFLSSLKYPS